MTSLRLCEQNFKRLMKQHPGWKQRVHRTHIYEKNRVCASFEEGYMRMMTYEGIEIGLLPIPHEYEALALVSRVLYPNLFPLPSK